MPSAKYSFKLEGERQWNINRKSRVLTKHVPANGAPGNASGMVHMLMVQSQAEFFLGGHRMGRSVYPFGVRSLFRTRVLVLVAFYGLRVCFYPIAGTCRDRAGVCFETHFRTAFKDRTGEGDVEPGWMLDIYIYNII